jgi:hypothetical protein
MAAREFLMFHEEAVYGTPVLTTSAPTTGRYNYIRLDQQNAFNVPIVRNKVDVARGDGYAGRGMVVKVPGGMFTGQLRFILCWSQVTRMLGWAGVRINSGKTAPWAVDSGQSVGDLASMTAYYGFERSDGTIKRRSYKGGKVARWTLEASRESPLVTCTYDLVFKEVEENDTLDGADASDPNSTEFPSPAATDYATDPILWQDLDGGLIIASSGSTARTNVNSLSITCENPLAAYYGTSDFLELLRMFGERDVTLSTRLLLKATPDDRSLYENQTALDVKATFASGNRSVLFDLNAANRISEPPANQFTPGQWYEHELTVSSYQDTAETTDFVITIDDTA